MSHIGHEHKTWKYHYITSTSSQCTHPTRLSLGVAPLTEFGPAVHYKQRLILNTGQRPILADQWRICSSGRRSRRALHLVLRRRPGLILLVPSLYFCDKTYGNEDCNSIAQFDLISVLQDTLNTMLQTRTNWLE